MNMSYSTDAKDIAIEIIEATNLTLNDLDWFEEHCPEVLYVLESHMINPYRYCVEVFGTWDAWCDYCDYYDIEDADNPPNAVLFDNEELSGIIYIGF